MESQRLSMFAVWAADSGLQLDKSLIIEQIANVKKSWPDSAIDIAFPSWEPVEIYDSGESVRSGPKGPQLGDLVDRMDFGLVLLAGENSPPSHCVDLAATAMERRKKLVVLSPKELDSQHRIDLIGLLDLTGRDIRFDPYGGVEVYEAVRRVLTSSAVIIDRDSRTVRPSGSARGRHSRQGRKGMPGL